MRRAVMRDVKRSQLQRSANVTTRYGKGAEPSKASGVYEEVFLFLFITEAHIPF